MDIENVKRIVESIREYNDMPMSECVALVDECLDGERDFPEERCKEFLVNRFIVQLECEIGAK